MGRAANYAAKLTSLSSSTPTWITADVFNTMADSVKFYEGKAVWQPRTWTQMDNHSVYCSSWYWGIN